MKLYGRPISAGYASGCAVVVEPTLDAARRHAIAESQIQTERQRFAQARRQACLELTEIRDRVLQELGKSHSAIFEAHLSMLEDPAFTTRIERRIEDDLVNAEQALDTEIRELCNRLEETDSPYLKERTQDLRDLGRRVLSHLADTPVASPFELPEHAILIARELLPSDTLNIDRQHLVAIVTEEGGETSHSAILARALGLPAVTGVRNLIQQIHSGMHILINGESGEITIAPTEQEVEEFGAARRQWETAKSVISAASHAVCATSDGLPITLTANLGRPEEAEAVNQQHLDGVGLLRTEFLFLDAPDPPDCDYQAEIYAGICRAIGGRPLIIRTLDMSADKRPRFLKARFAQPRLSFRGLRFSLEEGALFRTQVTAIGRVAKSYNVSILLPMVVDAHDVDRAVDIIQDSLGDGIRRPPVGAMIETPAAMILLEDFIEKVDFVSIGTNDLTQYLLAADREAVDDVADYSILHPAVLRSIRQVVAIAAAADKPLSVCGEAGGDPDTACLLIGMGVRQLSMSPAVAPQVRYRLQMSRVKDLENLAYEAMACKTTAQVREVLHRNLCGSQQHRVL